MAKKKADKIERGYRIGDDEQRECRFARDGMHEWVPAEPEHPELGDACRNCEVGR